MSELNQEEQQQEEVRENSEQDTLKLGVSRRTFIGAGMTAAAAALVLPRQAQGITELIEGNGAGAGGLGDLMERRVNITNICKPVAFSSPEFSVPPNQWKFNCDPASRTAPLCAPQRLEARKATLTYTGRPVDEADIRNAPDSEPASQSAEVRVFYDPKAQSPDGGGCVQSPDGGGSVAHMEVLLGPTIICDRGGIIDFELTNYLPGQGFDEVTCHDLHEENRIQGSSDSGCFEEFSMHFHGLHVSPISGTCQNTSGQEIEFSSDHIFAPLVPDKGEDYPLGSGDKQLYYTKRRFRLAIPEFHAPGTHWYHTHLHGTTAVQTSNGMAGAIIIRKEGENEFIRGEDESTNLVVKDESTNLVVDDVVVDDEHDRIWLIQEFVAGLNDESPKKDEKFYVKTMAGQEGRFLVNGQYVPTLNITEGCPQRWRFINATGTPRGPMQLKLYKLDSGYCDDIGTKPLLDKLHEELRGKPETDTEEKVPGMLVGDQEAMYLIAVDGISFYGHNAQKVGPDSNHDDYKEGWKFAPGNRADFLVNLEAGKYYVLRDQYMKSDDNQEGVGDQYKSSETKYRQVLGFINVKSSGTGPVDSDLSSVKIVDDRPNYLRPIYHTELQNSPEDGVGCKDKPRIIDFAVKGKGLYEINSKQFNTKKDDDNREFTVPIIKVGLNTAERWLLRNIQCDVSGDDLGYKDKSAPHPFHIHVNPFQVEGELIDPSSLDTGPDNWRWRDVLAVDFQPVEKPVECAGGDGSNLGEFGENADLDHAYSPSQQNLGYYKMIRNRFADFDGEYVVHCHILIHEDQGMMRKLIVGDAEYFNEYPNGAFKVEPGVVRHHECTDDDGSTDPTCYTA
jgi:FtsP/CotA-like multicopper oxidase with cupredoxin domain